MVYSKDSFQSTAPSSRDLVIVAHLDDDLLFMNPDILTSIRDGNTVRTIYIIAMIAADDGDYWHNRENGVKAAYAFMAGMRNQWQSCDYTTDGQVHHMAWLEDAPQISLVFLRLPDRADPRPGVVTFRGFDDADPDVVMESVDGASRYTSQELLQHLTSLIIDFAPTVIRLQDWQTTEDDDREIMTPEKADHPDHIRTARMTRLAAHHYSGVHKTIYYRNYNINCEPPNLAPAVVREKRAAFLLYVQHDSLINGNLERPYSSPLSYYEPWLERQYTAPEPQDT